jgi:2-haloacid dehalogenase
VIFDDDSGGAVTREALAFDLYGTLVDPIAISGELGRVLGESDGGEAARLWRSKQLEYSFRLTAMGRYEDFRWVTSRALDFALASIGARLTDEQTERLVELYDHLRPFPDTVPALRALAGLGYELAVFSNGTPAMIRNCLDNSGLGDSVGAGAAGMRTAWVNRSAAPFDTIGAQPDLTVPALDRLPAALGG